jgi:2-polyprenyl-6-methoxyphenol hydroxylase-like FAD-dependent oxidoreductase
VSARSAVVIGAGIAGLASAIALKRAGFDVVVHERADRLEPIGAALSLWPNAVAALRILGAAYRIEAEAAPIPALGVADARGRWIFGPVPVARYRGCAAYLPTRTLLQEVLLEALGPGVVRFGVDGRAIATQAALTIDASGIWSHAAGAAPRRAGYGGVLALSEPVEGAALPAGVEYWGDDERLGLFDAGGGRRYWFYIAGDRLRPAEMTRAWIEQRAAAWPEPARAAIGATPLERLIPIDIHARPAPRRLRAGSTILVGDAAHAMEPNLGQGACQGLEDAVALLIAARSVGVPDIAAEYERLRLKRVAQVVARSRGAALPVHGPSALRGPARAILRAIPAALHRAGVARSHRWPADFAARADCLESAAIPA